MSSSFSVLKIRLFHFGCFFFPFLYFFWLNQFSWLFARWKLTSKPSGLLPTPTSDKNAYLSRTLSCQFRFILPPCLFSAYSKITLLRTCIQRSKKFILSTLMCTHLSIQMTFFYAYKVFTECLCIFMSNYGLWIFMINWVGSLAMNYKKFKYEQPMVCCSKLQKFGTK